MMPASPPPAPDPFRAPPPRPLPPGPMPVLWLAALSRDAFIPPIGKYGLN